MEVDRSLLHSSPNSDIKNSNEWITVQKGEIDHDNIDISEGKGCCWISASTVVCVVI